MKVLTNLLLVCFAIHSVSALAESFEINGVVQSVNLAKSIIRIDDTDYQLANRVADSNSKNKTPVIYQLEEGSVVRIVGTVNSPMNRIDALAILPHEATDPTAQEAIQ